MSPAHEGPSGTMLHPGQQISGTLGVVRTTKSIPATELVTPGTERGEISQLGAGADRGASGQRTLQEPRSQDGAWDLGAGSHQAATDGPMLQETAPATQLPPA